MTKCIEVDLVEVFSRLVDAHIKHTAAQHVTSEHLDLHSGTSISKCIYYDITTLVVRFQSNLQANTTRTIAWIIYELS